MEVKFSGFLLFFLFFNPIAEIFTFLFNYNSLSVFYTTSIEPYVKNPTNFTKISIELYNYLYLTMFLTALINLFVHFYKTNLLKNTHQVM